MLIHLNLFMKKIYIKDAVILHANKIGIRKLLMNFGRCDTFGLHHCTLRNQYSINATTYNSLAGPLGSSNTVSKIFVLCIHCIN